MSAATPIWSARLLRCVANTPAPAPFRVLARFMLALNYQVARRYVEAELLFRAIVPTGEGDVDPAFESMVRQKLADTLEALGRGEEAAAERRQASAALRDTEETFLGLQAKGGAARSGAPLRRSLCGLRARPLAGPA